MKFASLAKLAASVGSAVKSARYWVAPARYDGSIPRKNASNAAASVVLDNDILGSQKAPEGAENYLFLSFFFSDKTAGASSFTCLGAST